LRWFDFFDNGMYVQTYYILSLDEFLHFISYQNSTLRSPVLEASWRLSWYVMDFHIWLLQSLLTYFQNISKHWIICDPSWAIWKSFDLAGPEGRLKGIRRSKRATSEMRSQRHLPHRERHPRERHLDPKVDFPLSSCLRNAPLKPFFVPFFVPSFVDPLVPICECFIMDPSSDFGVFMLKVDSQCKADGTSLNNICHSTRRNRSQSAERPIPRSRMGRELTESFRKSKKRQR